MASPDIGLADMVRSGWYPPGGVYDGFAIAPDDVVIDAGCGGGTHAAIAGRSGAHVIAFDIAPECVAATDAQLKATSARAIQTFVSNGMDLPLKSAMATKIICTEVLEHVEDPVALLAELVRIGQPGAHYILSVPDSVSEEIQRPIAGPFYFRAPGHVRIFTPQLFALLVSDCGLEIERHDRAGFYHTLRLALHWATGAQDLRSFGQHVLTRQWDETWRHLMDSPQGLKVKEVLDAALPRTQVILARKPL